MDRCSWVSERFYWVRPGDTGCGADLGSPPRHPGGSTLAGPGPLAILTEQDDYADEDGHDGTGAQASRCHCPDGGAVTILVAWAHLDFDDGRVGQRGVPRVCDDDGDIVHPGFQVQDAQAELRMVPWHRVGEQAPFSERLAPKQDPQRQRLMK